MTQEQIKKRVEKLDQKASEIASIMETLREYQAKCEKRINEAYSMAHYEGQKFAKEWESEQHHQERNLANFVRVLTDYSEELDKVCEEIEKLEKKRASTYYEVSIIDNEKGEIYDKAFNDLEEARAYYKAQEEKGLNVQPIAKYKGDEFQEEIYF